MAYLVVFILTFKALYYSMFGLQILAFENSLAELVIEGIIHEGVFLANHCDWSNLVINR